MFIFLSWNDKVRSFIRVNMSLKYAKIWLNSCESNSSIRSQWRSYRKTVIWSRSWKKRVKTLLCESQKMSVCKSKTVCSLSGSSQSNLKWFRARPLIQSLVCTEIKDFLQGKVFDAKAWRWRKQWVPCKCWISCCISVENPDLFPRTAGAPSVHTKPILWIFNSHFAKKSFTNWNTSFALVVVFSSSQKSKLSFMVPTWTNWLQFQTSVVSSNWRKIFSRSSLKVYYRRPKRMTGVFSVHS